MSKTEKEAAKTATVPVTQSAVTQGAANADPFWHPILSLRSGIDRLFENFLGAPLPPWGQALFAEGPAIKAPATDIVENGKEYRLAIELPGIDEKDITVKLAGDVLTIRGEKKEEKEEKTESYRLSERRYGSFQRSLQIPEAVERDGITASYDKGVLNVVLPKTERAQAQEKTIPVSKAA